MGQARGNGTEAARIAGYRGNDRTLKSVASENLAKPAIAAAVAERVDSDPLVMDREALQRFWSDMTLGRGEFEGAKHTDRLKASELLGKCQALFTDRHQVSGEGSVTHTITFFKDD